MQVMNFAVATVHTSSLPYQFSIVEGGKFPANSRYGSIEHSKFCLFAVLGTEYNGSKSKEEDQNNGGQEQDQSNGGQSNGHEDSGDSGESGDNGESGDEGGRGGTKQEGSQGEEEVVVEKDNKWNSNKKYCIKKESSKQMNLIIRIKFRVKKKDKWYSIKVSVVYDLRDKIKLNL